MLLGLVAERVGARVTRLIYLDALVPVAGDSALDLLPARARREVEVAARAAGGWRVPPLWPAAEFGITDQADRAWVDRRLTDQPLGTFMQPVGAASRQGIPRTYIACTAPRRDACALGCGGSW
jgi:hypothetical protein